MSADFNYEAVLHAVSKWPVDRRAMLACALVEGLKNDASGRAAAPSASVLASTSAPPKTAAPAAPAGAAAPQTQSQKWADEDIDDRYRRGGRMG